MQIARAYDTHKVIKKFIALGFSEEQSEGMVEESVNLLGQAQGDLATKSDLQAVRAELKEVEMRLEHKIEQEANVLRIEMRDIHSSLIRWFIGALFAAVGIMLTALKFFL